MSELSTCYVMDCSVTFLSQIQSFLYQNGYLMFFFFTLPILVALIFVAFVRMYKKQPYKRYFIWLFIIIAIPVAPVVYFFLYDIVLRGYF